MTLPANIKAQILELIDELPTEAVDEVRAFIKTLMLKHQQQAQQAPVAIGGWLVGYRFSSDEIARARSEMWGRFADDAS